jgi:vacuolar protein sorting-associated protein 18
LVTEGCLFAIDDIRSTYWIYSESCFYELVISDEDKDVWQIYLKKLQFDLALEHAKTPVQRDKVLIAQADYYFLQERFLLSASLYGQSNASFERILLKFFGLRDRKMSNGKLVSERMFQEATQRLLSEKFKRIKKTNIIQRQVISALLLDLKLVEYKNAADDKQETAALESIDSWIKSEDLRVLESTVAYQLFSSHGLFDKMIEYASTIGDYDKVMNHYVERKDWTNAVNTLAKQVPSCKQLFSVRCFNFECRIRTRLCTNIFHLC